MEAQIAKLIEVPSEFFANSQPEIQKFLFDRLYADFVADAIRTQKLHWRTGLIIHYGSPFLVFFPSLAL